MAQTEACKHNYDDDPAMREIDMADRCCAVNLATVSNYSSKQEERLNAVIQQWNAQGWSLVAVTMDARHSYMLFWRK